MEYLKTNKRRDWFEWMTLSSVHQGWLSHRFSICCTRQRELKQAHSVLSLRLSRATERQASTSWESVQQPLLSSTVGEMPSSRLDQWLKLCPLRHYFVLFSKKILKQKPYSVLLYHCGWWGEMGRFCEYTAHLFTTLAVCVFVGAK